MESVNPIDLIDPASRLVRATNRFTGHAMHVKPEAHRVPRGFSRQVPFLEGHVRRGREAGGHVCCEHVAAIRQTVRSHERGSFFGDSGTHHAVLGEIE
jgi:hypothetical protein